MNGQQYSTLFGAYNARHLHPDEVASTFVPQKRYWDLLSTSNNLLVGPRGSGKTTLLKMLQPEAMLAWRHERAEEAKQKMAFVGVFVPTDLNWSEEINVAVTALPPEERDTLTEALFVANVQLAFISSLSQLKESIYSGDLPAARKPISRQDEVRIVSLLERLWGFPDDGLDVPSLASFRASILSRIAALSGYRPNKPDRDYHAAQIKATLRSAQFNFENTLIQAIDAVEAATSLRRRWGLLFDEVELTNDFLQRALFTRLRASRSENIVYKLAVVPYVPTADILNKVNYPGISNDWTPVPLWYTDQNEAMRFCRDLWPQVARVAHADHLEPHAVFGSTIGHESDRHLPGMRVGRYGQKSQRQREFLSLYAKDPGFRAFMHEQGINPERLDSLPPRVMDSVVRKIAPLVSYRDQLIATFNDGRPKLRSAKSFPRLYSGWEAICIVSEGNPRWFKLIVDSVLREWVSNKRVVSRASQYTELERASRRFRALVAVYPVGDSTSPATPESFGPLQFVETVARFQKAYLTAKEFHVDMPLAVECDPEADSALLPFLSACLNVGAIISADEEDAALSLSALRGRKFRLSYLLAPGLILPLRTGKARALSTIFGKGTLAKIKKSRRTSVAAPVQRSLWDAL